MDGFFLILPKSTITTRKITMERNQKMQEVERLTRYFISQSSDVNANLLHDFANCIDFNEDKYNVSPQNNMKINENVNLTVETTLTDSNGSKQSDISSTCGMDVLLHVLFGDKKNINSKRRKKKNFTRKEIHSATKTSFKRKRQQKRKTKKTRK